MTEQEKRENEALKNSIQEAYGLSDEQLLAELEELEATLSDDEFVGAEERIYNRIKEREAERSSDSNEETADTSKASNSNPAPIRKISKKKRWLVVGIAAALVVGAGVNTIGGNSPFLRQRVKEQGYVLNGGQNIVKTGDPEDAYKKVEETLGIPVLKLNHRPNMMVFEELIMEIDSGRAILIFSYGEQKVYFIQKQESKERSLGFNSDRKDIGKVIHNNWLSIDIAIEENTLDNGKTEFSATIYSENSRYRLFGKIPENVFTEMLMELSY